MYVDTYRLTNVPVVRGWDGRARLMTEKNRFVAFSSRRMILAGGSDDFGLTWSSVSPWGAHIRSLDIRVGGRDDVQPKKNATGRDMSRAGGAEGSKAGFPRRPGQWPTARLGEHEGRPGRWKGLREWR